MTALAAQESVTVTNRDELRLLRALQIAPRASFAHLGDVLGLSEQAVARRYRKLRREGMLRIFGVVNPAVSGQHIWHVRAHCRPNGTNALAEALAKRDDVAWVGLSAAGSEVLFSVRSRSAEERDVLLGTLLPRATQVLDLEAAIVMHYFLGLRSDDWGGLAELLSDAETDKLRGSGYAPPPAAHTGQIELDARDDAIIAALARDGRASYAELAAASGISEGRVTRRLAALLETGALLMDMDISASAIGFPAVAYLRCQVAPGLLDAAGQALAAIPEVSFAAATTGAHNLLVSVGCRSLADLYTLLTRTLGVIEGLQSVEIAPVGRIVKQSGALVIGERLVDPAPPPSRAASAESRRRASR